MSANYSELHDGVEVLVRQRMGTAVRLEVARVPQEDCSRICSVREDEPVMQAVVIFDDCISREARGCYVSSIKRRCLLIRLPDLINWGLSFRGCVYLRFIHESTMWW